MILMVMSHLLIVMSVFYFWAQPLLLLIHFYLILVKGCLILSALLVLIVGSLIILPILISLLLLMVLLEMVSGIRKCRDGLEELIDLIPITALLIQIGRAHV